MKILLTGDWHIDSNQPKYRIDNYFKTQYNKIKWIYDLCTTEKIPIILQAGDFFNTHKASDNLKQIYIRLLKDYKIYTLVVFGQHDLRFHNSDKSNTPLKVLEAGTKMKILSSVPLEHQNKRQTVLFYGSSWGEDIPKVKTKEVLNILVMHRMVLKDKKIWEQQQEHTWGNQLLKTTKFDLIVTGDNHETFAISQGDRYLVNAGSLMRSRIDQIKHKPCIFVYNTITKELDKRYIPIKADVLDINKKEDRTARNEELEAFISDMPKWLEEGAPKTKTNFASNLANYIRENKIGKPIQDIITEITGG